MRRNNNKLLFSIIAILILFIGIGYAYLTSNLSITGSATISNNTWDIHFNNIVVDTNSVPVDTGYQAATINPSDPTKITYSVKLNKPGDYYAFNVDIVNAGSIDGMIESIISKVNNQDISNLPSYLTYSISYLDGDPLMNNFLLSANTTETIKVKIEFKENINEEDLLDSSETLNFSLDINYTQAKNAINRLETYNLYWNDDGNANINEEASDLEITYASAEEVLSSNPYPFFIRTSVRENNMVQHQDIGIKINGTVYYLIGGGATYDEATDTWDYTNVPYQDNKNTLISAFGSGNCEEDNQYDYSGIRCSKSGIESLAKSNGYVHADEVDWLCYVDGVGNSQCYRHGTG